MFLFICHYRCTKSSRLQVAFENSGIPSFPAQWFDFHSGALARVDIDVLGTPISTYVAKNDKQSKAN